MFWLRETNLVSNFVGIQSMSIANDLCLEILLYYVFSQCTIYVPGELLSMACCVITLLT